MREYSMLVKVLAFSMPGIGLALMIIPVTTVLGGVYAKDFGLTLTTIASVMLIARFFDAVTDPIVGYYSDQWKLRTGSRKPFIIVGAFLLVPSSYFLFVPEEGVDFGYFTCWYMAFYLAVTLFYIPYLAWSNEFTVETKDKSLVFSMSVIANQAGGALFYLIPLLPFSVGTDITPKILEVTVIVAIILFLLGLMVAFKLVPDGVNAGASRVVEGENNSSKLLRVINVSQAIVKNKPFLLFIVALMFLGVGTGMWLGMFFIYVDSYLKLGEAFAKVSLWGMVFGALAVPFWYRVSLLVGKRKAWLAGMTILTSVFLCTRLLNPEGGYGLFVLNMLMLFGVGSIGVIAGPMLCDAIDYGRLIDHAERNAVYFSIFTLLTKMQQAIGGALGMGIAGWFGFDVLASEQSPSGLMGLHIGVAWLPAIFVLMAMAFIAIMPLSEKRMVVIRKRLLDRDERKVSAEYNGEDPEYSGNSIID